MRALALASLSAGALCAPPPRLVGLYHAPGDVTACSLLSIDLRTGANATLARSPACAANALPAFPSFSAADAAAGTLFVAVAGAPTAFAVSVATGAAAPLAALANNASDELVGAAFFPGKGAAAGFFLVTQNGVWRASAPGAAPLFAPLADAWPAALVAASPGGGTGGAGRLFVADAASARVRVLDMGAPGAPAAYISGVARPRVLAVDGEYVYEEAGYVLSRVPAAGGAVQRVAQLTDGPGYPTDAVFAAPGLFAWVDFEFAYTIDVTAKPAKVTQLEGTFWAAPRRVGLPHGFA